MFNINRIKPGLRISYYIVVMMFLLNACSKKDQGTPTGCNLSSVDYISFGAIYKIAYNNQNRVSTITLSNGNDFSKTIYYNATNDSVITINSAVMNIKSTDVFQLDSFGRPVSDLITSGSSKTLITYTYNTDGEIISSLAGYVGVGAMDIRTDYTYLNGDLISETGGASTINYTYDISKPYMVGDDLQISWLIRYGIPLFSNQHLVTGENDNGSMFSFAYTQDSTQKITNLITTIGSVNQTTNYSYSCN